MPEPYPVPSDAVRVWRGYRAAGTPAAPFLGLLGATFVPAATLMQPPVGLRAYVPGVFAADDLPAGVPDETALLFWDSQEAYAASFETLAERVYSLTHAGVYDMTSSAATFPVPFAGTVESDCAYALLATPADWMTGGAYQLVVSVPGGPPLASIGEWAAAYVAAPPAGLDGAYLLAGAAYVVWWELWSGTADPAARTFLAGLGDVVAGGPCVPTAIDSSLDAPWPGITVSAGDLFSMQFDRPTGETS